FRAVLARHANSANVLARLRHLDACLHLLALEHGIAVVRGEAAGFEPLPAEGALAKRPELAEMGGAFDGAALEAELLRGRIVMDRGMRVVGLRMQHLFWLAPGSVQRAIAFGDFGVEGFHDRISMPVCSLGKTAGGIKENAPQICRHATNRGLSTYAQSSACCSQRNQARTESRAAGSSGQNPPWHCWKLGWTTSTGWMQSGYFCRERRPWSGCRCCSESATALLD